MAIRWNAQTWTENSAFLKLKSFGSQLEPSTRQFPHRCYSDCSYRETLVLSRDQRLHATSQKMIWAAQIVSTKTTSCS